MSTRLSGPMLPPRAGGAPRSAVVLLHGYGSDGTDLIGLGQAWAPAFALTVFLAPNGPADCAINPGGYQWFGLDLEAPARPLPEAFAAGEVVVRFLDDLWAQTGLTPADTALVGFSQGAMMALDVTLRTLTQPVAGVVSFSGALIAPDRLSALRPPVLLVHGALDDVVPVGESTRAAAVLEAAGYDVSLHVSPATGHSISPDGFAAATAFLTARIGG